MSLQPHPMSQVSHLDHPESRRGGLDPTSPWRNVKESAIVFIHSLHSYILTEEKDLRHGISTSQIKAYGISRAIAGAWPHWSKGIGLEWITPGFETTYATYWVILSQLLKLTESQDFCLWSRIMTHSRAVTHIPSTKPVPSSPLGKCSPFQANTGSSEDFTKVFLKYCIYDKKQRHGLKQIETW